MPARQLRQSRAFTLIELLVVIAVVAVLVSLLLGAVNLARKSARHTVCQSNMRTMGTTVGTYSSTFQDRIYAFTWNKDTRQSAWDDLNNHDNDLTAAADQAVDILRRRADRPDFPNLTNWIPHISGTHLVVLDFLNARLPDKQVICPEDAHRNAWARDPRAFDQQAVIPYPGGMIGPPRAFGKIWPYSSSYYTVVASFERIPGGLTQLQDLLYLYYPNRIRLGGNKLGDVVFPSSKVLSYDSVQRHYGRRQQFWGYEDIRMPLAFFDGSVRVKLVGESNMGWDPLDPTSPDPLLISYKPATSPAHNVWQPPARSDAGEDLYPGRFTWTRGGIRGVDFGGGEVGSGQPLQ